MKQLNKKTLKEHLSENDLKWMVSDDVLIDMYKTKLGEDKDYIVLAIAVNDKTPAEDLSRFISNSIFKFEDVEVSPATDTKGRYLIYVEFKRNADVFDNVAGVLRDTQRLSGIENWKFKTMGMDQYIPFDHDSFVANVITDPVAYEQRFGKKEEEEIDTSEYDDSTDSYPGEENGPAEESVQEAITNRLKFLLKY